MPFEEPDIVIILATSALAVILVVFFLFIIIRNHLKNANKHLEDIRLIYETQEKERDRIARDLHDGLGSLLSAAKMHVGLLKENESKDEIAEAAGNISGILDQAVGDLRTLVRNLVPRKIAEKGWIAELHELKKHINNSKNKLVSIQASDESIRFSLETELNLYRIVQELINNAMKHSGADNITVSILNKEERLLIEVRDNGKGINPDDASTGHGLKNIRSRLYAYKGLMEIKNNVKQGTLIIISFETRNIK